MFEHQLKHPAVFGDRVSGIRLWQRIKRFQKRAADLVAICHRLAQSRPFVRNIGMPVTFPRVDVRINATAKEIVEVRVVRLPLQQRTTDLIPGKHRKMTYVKNKRMPPDDRLGQQRLVGNHTKNLVRTSPGSQKLVPKNLYSVLLG